MLSFWPINLNSELPMDQKVTVLIIVVEKALLVLCPNVSDDFNRINNFSNALH